MGRRPTFEEYQKRENWTDGIKRCDDLLKKSPKDFGLLIVKLQLICAAGASEERYQPVLEQLAAIQPPIHNPADLATIEDAIDTAQQNLFPLPLTTGTTVAKLWDAAGKVTGITVAAKYDLLSLRFSRAIAENRLADAQQALIQFKALQPRNRAFYMAHAAYTQLLSKEPGDMQARLALMLAKKAVADKFDTADDSQLDCRVPGQIFALQLANKDLEGIKDRPRLIDSKQVFEAYTRIQSAASEKNQQTTDADTDLATHVDEKMQLETGSESSEPASKESLIAGNTKLKTILANLVKQNASAKIFQKFTVDAIKRQHTATDVLKSQQHRATADACFLAISSLVRIYTSTRNDSNLFRAAFLAERLIIYHDNFHEARLILIYLYMRLGLGAPAFRLFESLRIKEIQHDTVGHVLFTRLSLVLPYPTKQTLLATAFAHEDHNVAPDPLERTQRALSIYPRHENRLAETELDVLSHFQTGMIFDLHALRDHLRRSLTRRITVLEHRRLARISGRAAILKHSMEISPRRVANWTSYLDNRDFDAAFNHGVNVERLLHADGPEDNVPDKRWIEDVLAADCVWSLINDKTPLVLDPENLLDGHQASTAESNGAASAVSADDIMQNLPALTMTERTVGAISRQLLSLLLSQSSSSSPSETSAPVISALSASLESLPIPNPSTATTSTAPTSSLPAAFLALDALKLILSTYRTLQKRNIPDLRAVQSSASAHLAHLKTYVRGRVADSKSFPVAIRASLLGGADDNDDGGICEALLAFGEDTVDGFADALGKDAREGWEGLEK
ncbi:uncharacterized protein K489DRAFT_335671, partial [Dissoconium aciculare CBS 342.82]|uniref:Uncharacterized protein n=1 Tax=Dissoconium aciculare CBS 342.82 TaxID=1314786 RepID=A0A6J3M8N3_9PEZI